MWRTDGQISEIAIAIATSNTSDVRQKCIQTMRMPPPANPLKLRIMVSHELPPERDRLKDRIENRQHDSKTLCLWRLYWWQMHKIGIIYETEWTLAKLKFYTRDLSRLLKSRQQCLKAPKVVYLHSCDMGYRVYKKFRTVTQESGYAESFQNHLQHNTFVIIK